MEWVGDMGMMKDSSLDVGNRNVVLNPHLEAFLWGPCEGFIVSVVTYGFQVSLASYWVL
jgi:hypothetical protein